MLRYLGQEAHADEVTKRTVRLLGEAESTAALPNPEELARGPALRAVREVLGPRYARLFEVAVEHANLTPMPFSRAGDTDAPPDIQSNSLLFEAIETVASPQLADKLVAEALGYCGLDTVPAQLEPFARFVREGVYRAVAHRLDRHAVEAVRARLEPLIERVQSASGLRRRRGLPRRARSAAKQSRIVVAGRTTRMKLLTHRLVERGDRVVFVSEVPEVVQRVTEVTPALVICEAQLEGLRGAHVALVLHRLHHERMPPVLLVGELRDGEDLTGWIHSLPDAVDLDDMVEAIDEAMAVAREARG